MNELDHVSFKILWSRLIGVVEEACATLQRCAFSLPVADANDCTAVLFDASGVELAEPQAQTATTFIGTIPRTVRLLLDRFPPETWRPGDVVITNDPWMGTGHLFDTSMLAPIFQGGTLVAFAATVAHSPDIGGAGGRIDSKDAYEEGIQIPPCWLYRGGERVRPVFDFIEANVRLPRQVMGDLNAMLSASLTMGARVLEIMDELQMDSLADFGAQLARTCDRALRDAIQTKLPEGAFSYEIQTDGLEIPLVIKCLIQVPGDGTLIVDYAGTSAQVDRAINCTMSYTLARTRLGLKAVLLPGIPNNDATFGSVTVRASAGSVVHATYPAPTVGRSVVGHFLPTAVIGALSEAIPDEASAEGPGPMWAITVAGFRTGGRRFSSFFVLASGQGATSKAHGMDVMAFPGNAANTPIELFESETGLMVLRKEVLRDSGGGGKHRGGFGQRFAFRVDENPVTVALWADRTKTGARGLNGGGDGQPGSVLVNGKEADVKQTITAVPGDTVTIVTPGGGGFGAIAE